MFEVGQEVIVNDAISAYRDKRGTVAARGYFRSKSYDGYIYTIHVDHGHGAVVSFAVRESNLLPVNEGVAEFFELQTRAD